MALTGTKTFVGFGFGAIQSGLFLYEAFQSGNFKRLVVAEVVPELVSAIRSENNQYCLNIAFNDRVEKALIGPIEILNPSVGSDRQILIEAIADADEISTAVPSVNFYSSEKISSLHRIMASGLLLKVKRYKPLVVIYAAENHNHAAEILEASVYQAIEIKFHDQIRSKVRFLNTVIGKMSQVVVDSNEIKARGLSTITPAYPRAFLVEEFNKILISKITFTEKFDRGIESLIEKTNLLPFEEAKLFGHNATHALAGYIGRFCKVDLVLDLQMFPGVVVFLRNAFMLESGEALIRKHAHVDPLFTQLGYEEYASDLIKRMFNPFLMDSIDRVTRDADRKLGWNDRLIGTLRLALNQGVEPHRYAFGIAAALASMDNSIQDGSSINEYFRAIWESDQKDEHERSTVITYVEQSLNSIKKWQELGFPDLELFFHCSHLKLLRKN